MPSKAAQADGGRWRGMRRLVERIVRDGRASEALATAAEIQDYAPVEALLAAYALERKAVFDTRAVVKSQKAYAEATGFFDARPSCLELPATCGTGRDPDQSFLAHRSPATRATAMSTGSSLDRGRRRPR
jgi:hypothetical protein